MRLKKGFTLAEILIVLMVIGVIATMTVPSMMKGVTESQYKTGFKKAYNTITNMSAKLGVEGKMPVSSSQFDVTSFFVAMMENLSVREVAQYAVDNRAAALGSDVRGLTYFTDGAQKTFGSGNGTIALNATNTTSVENVWISTDDGLAYTLQRPGAGTCSEKGVIASNNTVATMFNASCFRILVDVNGLYKTPNFLEPQSDIPAARRNTAMEALTGDRFYVFVGRDGVTAGNSRTNAAARIVADMK